MVLNAFGTVCINRFRSAWNLMISVQFGVMVWFVCDSCQSTMKKNKVEQHAWSCGNYSVSCVDCSVSFPENEFKNHSQCVTEAEKYQGKLYKPKKAITPPQSPITLAQTKKWIEKYCKKKSIPHPSKAKHEKLLKYINKKYSKRTDTSQHDKSRIKSQIIDLLQ